MEDDGDSSSFSIDANVYPVSTSSLVSQYHAWTAAASSANINNAGVGSNSTDLSSHFSPVSPGGHGSVYNDHILHPSQAGVDVLSVRLGQSVYHSAQSDRLGQSDAYHANPGQSDGSGRHGVGQANYHEHLAGQQERHLRVDAYHHAPVSSGTAQQAERLAQADYQGTAPQDRIVQSDYHAGQPDRLSQSGYHGNQQQDRLGQIDYHATQADRMIGLGSQDYQSDRLGGQQGGSYHSGQNMDKGLGNQAEYHSNQVDLDAVSIHADYERRHMEAAMLSKDLVDSGQRGTAIDYLTGQSSRDPLASLHRDIVGLQREIDLSVGQNVSPPQRGSGSGDLSSSSFGLDPASLPRDLSPYSQREVERVMMSADVIDQQPDSVGRSSSGGGVGIYPQDLAGNTMGGTRDLLDMSTLGRASGGRDEVGGRMRDVIHRPRDIQRALEVLDSLENETRGDMDELSSATNSGNKAAGRSYQTPSRLMTSTKRQSSISSSSLEMRVTAAISAAASSATGSVPSNFLSLTNARDPLGVLSLSVPSASTSSSRLLTASDFARQPEVDDLSRLRRELVVPYGDLSIHHAARTSTGSIASFQNNVDRRFTPREPVLCEEMQTSSRERLHEMMKQHQFCDAVLATTLHSVKVHKAVLCAASAYLCGVLSQTNMGKNAGRMLTVQFKADIPAPSLTVFIDFIYLGRAALTVKNARDLQVMARCLHMEALKKKSEEILWTSGLGNDTDRSIPELLLLEQHVDRKDQACTASLPVPVPAPPTSDVGVSTDPTLSTSSCTEASCQTDTEELCVASSDLSTMADKRMGSNALVVGGLGTLSLCKSSGVNISVVKDESPPIASNYSSMMTLLTTTVTTSKPHHKKQIMSEVSRPTAADVPELPSLDNPNNIDNYSVSVTGKGTVRNRKKSSTTSSPLFSPPLSLPGQTVRAIHHSYGTRAAAKMPSKFQDSANSQELPFAKESNFLMKTENITDIKDLNQDIFGHQVFRDVLVKSRGETGLQAPKHRGKMIKGRFTAVLPSETFQSDDFSSASTDSFRLPDSLLSTEPEEHVMPSRDNLLQSLSQPQFSQTVSSYATTFLSSALTPSSSLSTTSTTTIATVPPRGYRKRVIQALAEKEAAEIAATVAVTSSKTTSDPSFSLTQTAASTVAANSAEPNRMATVELEAQRQGVPCSKRKKKGKTSKRMLLSSTGGSGGLKVRAPPKKRAKMELAELEEMMREEEEEEEEEEEAADSGSMTQVVSQALEWEAGVIKQSEKNQATTGRLIKVPTSRGKRAKWIKNDKLSYLIIQLNLQVATVAEDGKELQCNYKCRLCNNEFVFPKCCIKHILTTHKVTEQEVISNVEVRKRKDEKRENDPTVCDICGYKGRDGSTTYMHYHKYFKHSVPLPKGWSVYKCDVCGKELFTKFQLKDHKRAHFEKTPFVCEICGTGFQSRTSLHSHVYHRHNTERKYSCDRCNKTFKTRTQLHVHERTHTGERPFSCPMCSYRSTTRGNMRVHLANRHKASTALAREIMNDMKPDIDVSLNRIPRQESSDGKKTYDHSSWGEPRRISKAKRRDTDTGKGSETQSSASNSFTTLREEQEIEITTSSMEQFLKTATGEEVLADDIDVAVKLDEGDASLEVVKEEIVVGPSSVLPANGMEIATGNLIPLPVEVLPPGNLCDHGDSTTVTLLPSGLGSVFHQQATDVLTTANSTTILVPESLMHTLQQQQPLHHHQQFFQHHHPSNHFTSFTVLGPASSVPQFTTSHDLIVSLNSDSSKGIDVGSAMMGLSEMGVVDGMVASTTYRQGGCGSSSGSNEVTEHLLQQSSRLATLPVTDSPDASQQHVQLYMQHSPISPAAPVSPSPLYVSVTPTPVTVSRQNPDLLQTDAGTTTLVLDQAQQQSHNQQYEANLLQVYYQQHFFPQNY